MKKYSVKVHLDMVVHYDVIAEDRDEAIRIAEGRAIGEELINMECMSTQSRITDVHPLEDK